MWRQLSALGQFFEYIFIARLALVLGIFSIAETIQTIFVIIALANCTICRLILIMFIRIIDMLCTLCWSGNRRSFAFLFSISFPFTIDSNGWRVEVLSI